LVTGSLTQFISERVQERTTSTFCFVAESSLIGVSRPADDYFSAWYFSVSQFVLVRRGIVVMYIDTGQHSYVFVAENHAVWSPDRVRKVRKKYGRLVKSSSMNINDMLLEHREQVFAKLLDDTEEWRVANRRSTEPVVIKTTDQTAQSFTPVNIIDQSSRLSPSPNPMTSPGRVPPMGVFSVTSPDKEKLGFMPGDVE
jgi:histone deacetylase 6